jgi:hypothetical protein
LDPAIFAKAMAKLWWCRTCKILFEGTEGTKVTRCPGRHASFVHTKKIPPNKIAEAEAMVSRQARGHRLAQRPNVHQQVSSPKETGAIPKPAVPAQQVNTQMDEDAEAAELAAINAELAMLEQRGTRLGHNSGLAVSTYWPEPAVEDGDWEIDTGRKPRFTFKKVVGKTGSM